MKMPISDEKLSRIASENQFRTCVDILILQIKKASDLFIETIYSNDHIKPSDYKTEVDLIVTQTNVLIEEIKGVIGENDWDKALDAINKAINKAKNKAIENKE